MYKAYASAGYDGYLYPLLNSGKFSIANTIEESDVVLFAGGADINPAIYGHKKHPWTSFNTRRDTEEIEDFNYAKLAGIPMIGICRGMQLLTALSGGSLYQHVENHAGAYHYMKTVGGELIRVNSLHHQMCNPWDGATDFQVLGWSEHALAGTIISATGEELPPPPVEPEAIYFHDINAFCVQWHPEMLSQYKPMDKEAILWYLNCVHLLMEGMLHGAQV